MSVGYDLYLKLLEEAVLEERGEEKRIETECAADLTVNAHIPDRYVPSAEQRMDLYRRIAAIRTDEDASDLLDEMLDRYGEAPKSVLALLDVALLRSAAAKAGVSDISQKAAPAAAAGSVPPTGPGGGVRPRQVPPAADAGGGGDPCPHPEAQARGGCAGGRPGPGGGPEAGRGGGRGRDPVSFIMFCHAPHRMVAVGRPRLSCAGRFHGICEE